MEYRDNYPNGYKSGYSSADDPDRKDYSPMGEERARRNTMAKSEESDYDSLERYKQERKRREEQYEQEMIQKEQERKTQDENMEKRTEVIRYLTNQKRENHRNKGFFKKAIAALNGKGYWKVSNQYWDQSVQEVNQMSDKEINNFYNTHIR